MRRGQIGSIIVGHSRVGKFLYGFTLIELLVVISIIALLLSILMPALSKVKEQGKRVVCSSNLKQMNLALAIYAHDNLNRFPVDPYDQSHWMWDVSVSIIDTVIASGGTRETFYCPSNQLRNHDSRWNIAVDLDQGAYRGIGYYLLAERGQILKGDFLGTGNKKFLKKLTASQSSRTELVLDATISLTPEVGFERVSTWEGGYSRTNHLKHGTEPMGGNISFADGHVEWRRFDDMEVRWHPSSHYPYEWW